MSALLLGEIAAWKPVHCLWVWSVQASKWITYTSTPCAHPPHPLHTACSFPFCPSRSLGVPIPLSWCGFVADSSNHQGLRAVYVLNLAPFHTGLAQPGLVPFAGFCRARGWGKGKRLCRENPIFWFLQSMGETCMYRERVPFYWLLQSFEVTSCLWGGGGGGELASCA